MRKRALRFVLLIGVMSFFADFVYEGARSVTGPYLAVLGASATLVGFIAGLGELLGYGLRLVSGKVSERTREFWPITIFGYVVQMSAVPLLAYARTWQMAGVLIVLERVGRAIRNPPRDVMLSHAGKQVGMGWAFGLHEAVDRPLLRPAHHDQIHAVVAALPDFAQRRVELVGAVERVRHRRAGHGSSMSSCTRRVCSHGMS